MPDPRTCSDTNFALGHHLHRNRSVHILVPVILIRDVDIVTRPDIIVDADREVSNDATSLPDQTPVSDLDDAISDALLSGNHPRGQGAMWADHRVTTDVDVLLVEDGVRRKAHDTVRSETPE